MTDRYTRRCACPYGESTEKHYRPDRCDEETPFAGADPARWSVAVVAAAVHAEYPGDGLGSKFHKRFRPSQFVKNDAHGNELVDAGGDRQRWCLRTQARHPAQNVRFTA